MKRSTETFLRLRLSTAGLLMAAGTVACAATLCGFLGRCWWFFDLFSHFRVQYAAGLTLIALFLLLIKRRNPTPSIVFVLAACLNAATVIPLYLGLHRRPTPCPITLRAMLVNVNTRLGNPRCVLQAIRSADPDILLLEEIDARWVSELSPLTRSYPFRCMQTREDNFGIGLFSKLPIAEHEVVYIGTAGVPTIIATLDTGTGPLQVIGTHPLPPVNREYTRLRNEQLEQIPGHTRQETPVLLLGDLNVTPWNHRFRRLLREARLKDSARSFGVQPSWPARPALLRIPLDHCLHSEAIAIVDRRIGPDVCSDHFPIIVDFTIRSRSGQTGSTAPPQHG